MQFADGIGSLPCENFLDEGLIEEKMENEPIEFLVKYFPTGDEPKFLIQKFVYEKSVELLKGTRPFTRVRFDDETLMFEDRECHESEFPWNYFRSMRLRKQDEENHMVTRHHVRETKLESAEAFSPWEIDFYDQGHGAGQKRKKKDESLELIHVQEEQQLIEVKNQIFQIGLDLQALLEPHEDYFSVFWPKVDTETFKNYLDIVKVEMFLEKVFVRIENAFYHSVAQLVKDIQQIRVNAYLFNESGSGIRKRALVLEQI
jgi:hypothetical protein